MYFLYQNWRPYSTLLFICSRTPILTNFFTNSLACGRDKPVHSSTFFTLIIGRLYNFSRTIIPFFARFPSVWIFNKSFILKEFIFFEVSIVSLAIIATPSRKKSNQVVILISTLWYLAKEL